MQNLKYMMGIQAIAAQNVFQGSSFSRGPCGVLVKNDTLFFNEPRTKPRYCFLNSFELFTV